MAVFGIGIHMAQQCLNCKHIAGLPGGTKRCCQAFQPMMDATRILGGVTRTIGPLLGLEEIRNPYLRIWYAIKGSPSSD